MILALRSEEDTLYIQNLQFVHITHRLVVFWMKNHWLPGDVLRSLNEVCLKEEESRYIRPGRSTKLPSFITHSGDRGKGSSPQPQRVIRKVGVDSSETLRKPEGYMICSLVMPFEAWKTSSLSTLSLRSASTWATSNYPSLWDLRFYLVGKFGHAKPESAFSSQKLLRIK